MSRTLEIPEDIFDSARLTLPEMKVELAVALYAAGRLSVGKAHELAEMSLWQFRQLLAAREIEPHFDDEELQADAATLKALGRL